MELEVVEEGEVVDELDELEVVELVVVEGRVAKYNPPAATTMITKTMTAIMAVDMPSRLMRPSSFLGI